MTRWIIPRNWHELQHYKDRSPPWIKLYTRLLADADFLDLEERDQLLLIKVWLAYARADERLPDDAENIARQIASPDSVAVREGLDRLLAKGFLASRKLAGRYHAASVTHARATRSREESREEPPKAAAPRKKRGNRADADPPSASGAVEDQPSPNGVADVGPLKADPEGFKPDPEGMKRIAEIMGESAEKAELERAEAAGADEVEIVKLKQAVSRRWLEEHKTEVERLRAAKDGPADEGAL